MVDIFIYRYIYIYMYVVIFSLCRLVHKVKSLRVGCGLLVGKQDGDELMQDQQSDVKEGLGGRHCSRTGSVLLS